MKDCGETKNKRGDDDKKGGDEFKRGGVDNKGKHNKKQDHIPRYVMECVLSSPLKSNKLMGKKFLT